MAHFIKKTSVFTFKMANHLANNSCLEKIILLNGFPRGESRFSIKTFLPKSQFVRNNVTIPENEIAKCLVNRYAYYS